ncbi:MAG TPA: hypothetical protein DDY39_07905, partial [Nitrospira sp.]|nr:hypothetical protein [Nitrospira sp.]
NLAGMGRVSILAGDTHRLDELAQEILAVSPVAYVTILSPNGDLQTGYGKDDWQQQFSVSAAGRRQFSVTKLVSSSGADKTDPIVNGIWLSSNGPFVRPSIDFSPSDLLNLLGGYELPIFYDLLIQVPRQSRTGHRDPALTLTLEERPGSSELTQKLLPPSPSLVEIGLSTSDLQQNLRRLLWQAVLITLNTLIGGICIAVLLARRMTVPLQALTTAATKLGAGETTPTIAIQARDEIGTLTQVFNSMALQLQTREHELRELAQTLEERVNVRTQELAAANAKLQELDRRKSIFVSTASHELRTPLTSMKVHLANLRDGIDGAVTPDQRGSLLRVEANLSRLRTLIEELLDLSQIELGQTTLRMEAVELGSVIAKTVEDLHSFTSERSVKIVISLPTDLPLVSADPEKMRQILLNLLHNAVKFSPMNTIVDLNITRLPSDTIQISVRDVGPGIAPEDVEKVFQPFYRAPTTHKKTKGTGLGLAIAKLLVELHQSRLSVETEPGRGSCFYFTLQTVTPVRLAHAEPVVAREALG